MKKFSWIFALILALSIGFIGCPTGDSGDDTPPPPPPWSYTPNPNATDITINFAASGANTTQIVRTKVAYDSEGDPDSSTAVEPGTISYSAGGYTFTYVSGTGNYENVVNRFKVDLGEFNLADYGKITFKWSATGLKEDASVAKSKNLYLLATEDPDKILPFPAENWAKALVVSNDWFDTPHFNASGTADNNYYSATGAPTVNGNDELEVSIPIIPIKAVSYTGEIWLAIYVHAEKDSYTIKDVKLHAGAFPEIGKGTVTRVGGGDIEDAPPVPLVTATIPDKAVKYELDLTVANCSDAGTALINATVPNLSVSGGKLIVPFTENNQRVNVKIDATLKAALLASRGTNASADVYVVIVGEHQSGQNDKFRYHLGIINTNSNWNATASFADNYPFDGATGLTRALKLNFNGTDGTASDPVVRQPDYFILQHQSAEASTIAIEKIEVWVLPPPPPAVVVAFEGDGTDVFPLGGSTISDETEEGYTFTGGYGPGTYFKVKLPATHTLSEYSKLNLSFAAVGGTDQDNKRARLTITASEPVAGDIDGNTASTYATSDMRSGKPEGEAFPAAIDFSALVTPTLGALDEVWFIIYFWCNSDTSWEVSNFKVE